MTYSTIEASLELGAPVELYEFRQGFDTRYMTTGLADVLYAGNTYVPTAMRRGSIKQTTDMLKDSLSITFPRANSFVREFIGYAPDLVTSLTILRGHVGDGDYQVYWKGRVVGSESSENEVSLECESVFTSLRRPGLRARFEYGCRHTLYQGGCRLLKDTYAVTGTLVGVTGGIVEVSSAGAYANGYFTGGMFASPQGSLRYVVGHSNSLLQLSRPIPDLVAGGTVTIYPGCDHTTETCKTKFSNLNNFGGFPFIPARNPFDGSSVF